jgi:hypothetical protein
MCEQQIEGNGSDIDPSIVMTGNGTLVVLSLTNGGVLVSRDDGCSFERATGPLQGNRGVDLTLDPSQPGRVLALLSTILEVLEGGVPRYRNFLAHDAGSNHLTTAADSGSEVAVPASGCSVSAPGRSGTPWWLPLLLLLIAGLSIAARGQRSRRAPRYATDRRPDLSPTD